MWENVEQISLKSHLNFRAKKFKRDSINNSFSMNSGQHA